MKLLASSKTFQQVVLVMLHKCKPARRAIDYLYRLYMFNKGSLINCPNQVVYIPVESIKLAVNPINYRSLRFTGFFRYRLTGFIKGGNWDQDTTKLDDKLVIKGLKQRFLSGLDWKDTDYYPYYKSRLENQKKVRGCESWEEFERKRLSKWDEIYQDMKVNGYRKGCNPKDEVEIGISRNGEIIFIDGRHRMTMAGILNIEIIPVIVNVWHEDYLKMIAGPSGKRIGPAEAIKPVIEKYAFYRRRD